MYEVQQMELAQYLELMPKILRWYCKKLFHLKNESFTNCVTSFLATYVFRASSSYSAECILNIWMLGGKRIVVDSSRMTLVENSIEL